MPYYVYEGREKDGNFIRNQTFAANKEDLRKVLQQAGLTVLSIKESATIGRKYRVTLHRGVRSRDLLLFSRQLAVLLENGIPIIEAFEIILKQVESSILSRAIGEIKTDLEGGSSLRDAIAKHPRIFGDFWSDAIEAGELSGKLSFVLYQLASFIESREDLKKKTINAFLYPAMLFVLAISSLFMFVYRIVPIFEGFFDTFDAQLPVLTSIVVSVSYALRRYIFLILQLVILGIFIFRIILSTKRGRRIWENILFAMPLLGGFLLLLYIQRFISTLSILLKSGIPIVKALEVSKKASESVVFDEMIEEAKEKVIGGLPLSEALQQTGVFPTLVVQLAFVGEKTGNFTNMLDEISNYYNSVIDTAVTRFTTLLGPVVLIGVAAIIGVLVIAMFLPIFELTAI